MFDRWSIIGLFCVLIFPFLKEMIVLLRKKNQIRKLAQLPDEDLLVYIDNFIEQEREKQHMAAVSIGVVKNGKVVLRKAYGYADLENMIPATTETVFQLASVSKHIVAVCVLVLAEQGKLNLADDMGIYFPNAPSSWQKITIHNLLNHTSGLKRDFPKEYLLEQHPLEMLVNESFKFELQFSPGTKWQYSNVGFSVLASIIEIVSGERFQDYTNTFFEGNQLYNTSTTTTEKSAQKAIGYFDSRRKGHVRLVKNNVLRPGGAFVSNIDDMLRWDALLFESSILTKKHWQEVYSEPVKIGRFTTQHGTPVGGASVPGTSWFGRLINAPVLYYGYGWGITNYQNRRLLTHGGGNLGFTSEYWKSVDDKTSIIILTNTFGKNLARIAEIIYGAIEGKQQLQ